MDSLLLVRHDRGRSAEQADLDVPGAAAGRERKVRGLRERGLAAGGSMQVSGWRLCGWMSSSAGPACPFPFQVVARLPVYPEPWPLRSEKQIRRC
jgi:hypothetical protein